MAFEPLLPELVTAIPGPKSVSLVDTLVDVECPAITARRARRAEATGVGKDPIVWQKAEGANVWDADGNRFVDLAGAFAVMSVGHAHPDVVAAGQAQLAMLPHAMGDVFPSDKKIELGRVLADISPGNLQQSIFALSGASAVEAALKTAVMATGRTGVLAFHGAYHGLNPGALAATAYRKEFRTPFLASLNNQVQHVPYPGADGGPFDGSEEGAAKSLDYLRYLLGTPATGVSSIGAMIVECIQGRGGEIAPPTSWFKGLRQIADEHGIVLIFDEIYTGFGRTGRWFACEHHGVVPDIMVVGKAMGGGFPISAAIGTPEVMGAWGNSRGEAIHTSTFLGNPTGCAMALAAIEVMKKEKLIERSATLGEWLKAELETLREKWTGTLGPVRGEGLMLGLPILKANGAPDGSRALKVMDAMLQRGFIILPSGVFAHVLAFAPPFIIDKTQLSAALKALDEVLSEV